MQDYVPAILDKNVALVVNQTSLIGQTHLVDTLLAKGVRIKKIFAPEHGFRGHVEAGGQVRDTLDAKTGLPLISLYGKKKKPSKEDLKGIDIIVFDIQDVGARFYTYISTLHYVMEAAAENDITVYVLDRPNPNAHYVDGPLLDTIFTSFVGMHPVPVVYGMTIGEYGRMINGEKWIAKPCHLFVISCLNYTHATPYTLPIPPSPNLPNQLSVLLYPGICFFEGTSMSLGRGTAMPFQVIGHPDYPEHAFSFTPKSMTSAVKPPLMDQLCYGLDLRRTDSDSLFNQRKLDVSILLSAYNKMDKATFFDAKWFDTLAGGSSFRKAIEAGWTEQQIRDSWADDLAKFRQIRSKYLIYGD